MLKLMNGSLAEGQTAIAYAPVDGAEIRTTVVNDAGALYAKRPGSDAGIVMVDPSTVYIVSR